MTVPETWRRRAWRLRLSMGSVQGFPWQAASVPARRVFPVGLFLSPESVRAESDDNGETR